MNPDQRKVRQTLLPSIPYYIILYQIMQVGHSSFQDNKRATTAVEDGCESRSAQSGSEDAPVYCKFIVTLFLFHSSNYFQFIVSCFRLSQTSKISTILHLLQVQDVEAVLCDEAAVLGKISLKDQMLLRYN